MLYFLARRIAGGLITLLLASVVVFAVLEIVPGDPARLMLGINATDDAVATLREIHQKIEDLGFDMHDLAVAPQLSAIDVNCAILEAKDHPGTPPCAV